MASTQDSLLDLLADVEAEPSVEASGHVPEPTNPIERARDRIGGTLDYLVRTGNAPKRAQIVTMLRELHHDLAREADRHDER